jgi:hypothetical protein
MGIVVDKRKTSLDAAETVITPGGPRSRDVVHHVQPGEAVEADATGERHIIDALRQTGRYAPHDMVYTPGGPRAASQVHLVEPDSTLDVSDGRLRKLEVSGQVVTDFGEFITRPRITRQALRQQSLEPEPVPALGSGWITYASWTNSTGNPITSFSTTWTVPPDPATQSGQLIYLFNGIEDAGFGWILQPVLQWGAGPAGGGNYWSIASWYVDGPGGSAFHSNLIRVNSGDTLTGLMTLTGQASGMFSYNCQFQGIANSGYAVNNISELVWCNETLEAYQITKCSDYPDTLNTAFRNISIQTGASTPTVTWTPTDLVTDCGQNAVVVSNSATAGEVDLYYRRSGDWSGVNDNWRSLGGIFPVGAPVTAVSRNSGQLDLFICGNDGRVYTSWWTQGQDWTGINDNWRSLGGFFPAGAKVAAIARTPNNLDLFICGNDGRVYTSWWSAGADWSGINDNWRSIGGFFPVGAPLAVTSRADNNLDLFITGNDGRVYTSWWYAGSDWSGVNDSWSPLGGFFPVGAPLAAIARTSNNLDLFVCGNDGRVYTSWWSNGAAWSGINDNWRSIGGFFPAGAPLAATSRNDGNLDLFITGNDGRVYTSWWYAGADWSGVNDNWRSIGGFFPAGSPLAAVARTENNLDLFICGNDGRVYTSWWFAGVDWSGVNDNWRGIGGFFPAGAPPAAAARTGNNLDAFICGNDGRVYSSWWFA